MNILVILNSKSAPAGLMAERIAARGWTMTLTDPHRGDPLPGPTAADGLVALGGPQDAWDDAKNPAFSAIIAAIRGFIGAEKPVLGLCLGGQLLARALGARVRRMETGFERGLIAMAAPPGAPASIVPAGPLLLTSWHRDSFDLPAGAELLLSSNACAHQAFRVGPRVYGFQCHVEATPQTLLDWVKTGSGKPSPEEAAAIEAAVHKDFPKAQATGAAILDAWLDLSAAAG
ncbi:type 1 glutamine amidotransferase [Oleispirillum naphthae]|uniref:type 1 glutamine amidotransferase n=1 Tax=Oleispirillum naphthae TaxID=2838853 RepID=UPI0030822F0E